MGPSTYLTIAEEDALETWILHMSQSGFPVTKDQLLDSVEMIVKKCSGKLHFQMIVQGVIGMKDFLTGIPS